MAKRLPVGGRERDHKAIEDAFQVYHALGRSRSIRRVAKITGMSYDQLRKYSAEYGWRKRVADIEAAAAGKFDALASDYLAERRLGMLKDLHAAQDSLRTLIREEGFGKDEESLDKAKLIQLLIDLERAVMADLGVRDINAGPEVVGLRFVSAGGGNA